MTRIVILLLLIVSWGLTQHATAQKSPSEWPKHEFVVGGGITQLLAGGGNLQVDYYTGRWTFDYSHGFNLELTGGIRSQEQQDQKLNLRMPWTTGFGVGYRLTRDFSLRLEPKFHRFEVAYEDGSFSAPLVRYTTVTLGVGAYYRWQPFRNTSEGWTKGLTVMPSVRFWPNIASSLDNNEFRYQNRLTGRQEVHKAASQGFGGLFANITVGYSFN